MKQKINNVKVLTTGMSGFIGFYLFKTLLYQSYQIVGIDSLNDYYDISWKQYRLEILDKYSNFNSFKMV